MLYWLLCCAGCCVMLVCYVTMCSVAVFCCCVKLGANTVKLLCYVGCCVMLLCCVGVLVCYVAMCCVAVF